MIYGTGKEAKKALKTVKKIEITRPVLPTRKKVAAYARVSMESDRMMHSLSTQVSYYNELIQSNPEWEFAGVYADNFISGTSTEKRTEFQRMLADCEAGKIDISRYSSRRSTLTPCPTTAS